MGVRFAKKCPTYVKIRTEAKIDNFVFKNSNIIIEGTT